MCDLRHKHIGRKVEDLEYLLFRNSGTMDLTAGLPLTELGQREMQKLLRLRHSHHGVVRPIQNYHARTV